MANTALAPNLPTRDRTTCHRHSHGGPWISTYLHSTDIYRELLQAGVRGALQERAADTRHARHHLQSQRDYCIYLCRYGEGEDLAQREDGPPAPALHHHHAEHVAGDINHHTRYRQHLLYGR